MIERAVLEERGPVAVRYARGGEGVYHGLSRGASECCRQGTDFTLLTYGTMINEVLEAAGLLEIEGIAAEILKLNTIQPLDIDAIEASVRKTNALLVLEECIDAFSARVYSGAFDFKKSWCCIYSTGERCAVASEYGIEWSGYCCSGEGGIASWQRNVLMY